MIVVMVVVSVGGRLLFVMLGLVGLCCVVSLNRYVCLVFDSCSVMVICVSVLVDVDMGWFCLIYVY